MSIAENKTKGKHAEFSVSYLLSKIFNTNVDRYSGDEDKGIDLSLKFESPINNKLYDLNFQIKIGQSYVQDSGKYWRIIKIDEDRFKQWKDSICPVILIWIDDIKEIKQAYWTVITRSSSIKRLFISKRNILTPSTPYNLISILARKNERALKTITIKRLYPKLNISLREFAKSYFRKHLLKKRIINPVLGEIYVSWNLWHHLTSDSRKKKHILYSLELLPILTDAIQYCNRVYSIRKVKTTTRGNWTTEIRLIVFKINPNVQTKENPIFLVLRETITYSNDWERLFDIPEIKRQLIVESLYRKE